MVSLKCYLLTSPFKLGISKKTGLVLSHLGRYRVEPFSEIVHQKDRIEEHTDGFFKYTRP